MVRLPRSYSKVGKFEDVRTGLDVISDTSKVGYLAVAYPNLVSICLYASCAAVLRNSLVGLAFRVY